MDYSLNQELLNSVILGGSSYKEMHSIPEPDLATLAKNGAIRPHFLSFI